MDHKKVRKIMNSIAILVLIMIGLSYFPSFDNIRKSLMVFATLLIIMDLIFALVFFRCPYCNSLLNFRGKKQNYCSSCGRKL